MLILDTGTCTDVHESIETKFNAKRTRQHLLSVIAHSQVTIFSVDPNRCVTMLEGALIWNNTYEDNHDSSRWYIGENMYTVFNRLVDQLPEGEQLEFLQPIEDILQGMTTEDVKEHGLGKCAKFSLNVHSQMAFHRHQGLSMLKPSHQMAAGIARDSCPCMRKRHTTARQPMTAS